MLGYGASWKSRIDSQRPFGFFTPMTAVPRELPCDPIYICHWHGSKVVTGNGWAIAGIAASVSGTAAIGRSLHWCGIHNAVVQKRDQERSTHG